MKKRELEDLQKMLFIRSVVILTFLNSRGGIQALPSLSPFPIDEEKPLLCFNAKREGYLHLSLIDSEFVINFLRRKYEKEVKRCKKMYQEGVNKILQVGFHPLPSKFIRPQRIKEADAWIECKYLEEKVLGKHCLIFAEPLLFEVKEHLLKENELIFHAFVQSFHQGNMWLK